SRIRASVRSPAGAWRRRGRARSGAGARGGWDWSSRSCVFLLDRNIGDGRAGHGDVTPQRPVVEPERVLAGRKCLEHRSIELSAGDRPLVDLLVGALFVTPAGADL